MTGEAAAVAAYRRKTQPRSLDHELACLADRQYGVVSRAQLLSIGVGESAIQRRIASGRLHRLHAGVYSVGHRVIPREGRWLAAVLRCGEAAVLSHRSAAVLWGIRRGGGDRIEVTSPRATRSCAAICRHRAHLAADEVCIRRRISVTTLARTLLDIAAVSSVEAFEASVREAEYRHQLRPRDLSAALERHPGQRGTRTARTCLSRLGDGPGGRVRSRLEAKFAALLAQTDLPKPRLNALLDLRDGKLEADCLWPAQRLIVELDGGKAHRTHTAFESDRERDRRLLAAGWRVIRVTWRQLDDPDIVVRDLRALLEAHEDAPTAA
jgi:very-short-patch-repair endonuclease